MHDKFDKLSMKSIYLMMSDYTRIIDDILEENQNLDDFDFIIPRETAIAQVRHMEEWIWKHSSKAKSKSS